MLEIIFIISLSLLILFFILMCTHTSTVAFGILTLVFFSVSLVLSFVLKNNSLNENINNAAAAGFSKSVVEEISKRDYAGDVCDICKTLVRAKELGLTDVQAVRMCGDDISEKMAEAILEDSKNSSCMQE